MHVAIEPPTQPISGSRVGVSLQSKMVYSLLQQAVEGAKSGVYAEAEQNIRSALKFHKQNHLLLNDSSAATTMLALICAIQSNWAEVKTIIAPGLGIKAQDEILRLDLLALLYNHESDFQMATEKPKSEPKTHADPVVTEIEEILDRTIRPGLQADGGDIEIVGFTNNELQIIYQGACGGCPSSMMGTLDAIQGILRQELNNDAITVMPV